MKDDYSNLSSHKCVNQYNTKGKAYQTYTNQKFCTETVKIGSVV